ncbi:MAG TPA: helix-turn-helix domain-containing protein [Rubrivivax sp.]|nr:helix-turn-helix domain-containing protein [Rubrivivax sp.]
MSAALLTPAELAAHLRVSERTVARMTTEGCPSLLVGRRRRYDLAAVTAWMQSRAETTCPTTSTTEAATRSPSASSVAAFTAACRRVQLRVMPSGSKPS